MSADAAPVPAGPAPGATAPGLVPPVSTGQVPELPSGQVPLDYAALYAYRHRGTDQRDRAAVWTRIADHVHGLMGRPEVVLDPVAGRGEFVNAVPATERWAGDVQASVADHVAPGVRCVVGDVFTLALPTAYFGGIFVSNFLEHLPSPEAVQGFLARMKGALAPDGALVIMGPNFRYATREYYDFADHLLPLSHVTVLEHLAMAGLAPRRVIPRYLPYSFGGRLPAAPALVGAYLQTPAAWRLLGKQFLIVAGHVAAGTTGG